MRTPVGDDIRPGHPGPSRAPGSPAADDAAAAALFGALFEASPDGLLLIDGSGTVRAANGALSSMLGLAPEYSIGIDVASFVPAVATHVLRIDQSGSLASATRAVASFAYDVDGEAFPVDVELTPVEAGGERFTLALVRDTSDRCATAMSLRHAEEDLRSARQSHDTAIQQVFAAGMLLRAALAMAEVPDVRDRISTATEGLDATIEDLRDAIERLGGLDGDVLSGAAPHPEFLAIEE